MSGTGPETIAIRHGERLDTDNLTDFLSRKLSAAGPRITIEQFPGGSSNLTYLVVIGDDEFVLRRPPFGNTVKTAHDMRREFEVLSKLSAVYQPAPKPLLFCDDESVIGSEFYIMERRHGLIIRGKIRRPDNVSCDHTRNDVFVVDKGSDAKPPALETAKGDLETSHEFRISVCKSFMKNLADLHSIDPKEAGLENLGKPAGYNRRQVEGWTRRYFAAKTHELPELNTAIEWLNRHIPAESGAAIIHNDYKFDNIMLDPSDLTRITAVLDWEMVTTGDPLMDLGTTLGYWMSRDAGDEMLNMPFNPRVLMKEITRNDLVAMYEAATGKELPDMLFYYVFGTVKIAVIAQQIYARFVRGFTKDPRFARFDHFVSSLGRIASAALERGTVSL